MLCCFLFLSVYILQLDTAQKELYELISGTSAELDSEKRSKAALQRRVAELDAKVIYMSHTIVYIRKILIRVQVYTPVTSTLHFDMH
jgi:hypothetical protein